MNVIAVMWIVVVIVTIALVMRDSDRYRTRRRISRYVDALNLDGVAARAVAIAVGHQRHG